MLLWRELLVLKLIMLKVICFSFKNSVCEARAGEMAQPLRAHMALAQT